MNTSETARDEPPETSSNLPSNTPDGRSRDDAGRPRNARPRDRLGRPLPPGSAGVEPVPDELDLSVDEALAYAQRLLDEGRAFGAHEVLEAIWKASPEPERELWRSLAQLAVAVTHLERGNLRGARELALRATTGLESFRAEAPHQLDLDGLVGVGRRLVVEIDAGQVPAVPQMRLRAGP